jgi:hypothetical protein
MHLEVKMTDRNQCLLVNLYYGDVVNEFDKLLTDMRQSYIKESFHSSVHGQCYKFIIINYKEQEAISLFLLNKENVFTYKTIRLTDEQVNFLIDLFLK